MKQLPIWKIEIDACAGGNWEGLFTEEPTTEAIYCAVLLDITLVLQQDDEEDRDHFLERLQTVSQVALHLDADFIEKSQETDWLSIEAARIEIGAIRITILQAFQVEEPA